MIVAFVDNGRPTGRTRFAFRVKDKYHGLEPGKFADLTAVDRNPLLDNRHTAFIRYVIKNALRNTRVMGGFHPAGPNSR